jgi:hypothetical protein
MIVTAVMAKIAIRRKWGSLRDRSAQPRGGAHAMNSGTILSKAEVSK